MFQKQFAALLAAVFFAAPAFADEHAHGDAAAAQAFIKEILAVNAEYDKVKGEKFFQELAKGQHPQATVVTCSDSRVHTNMLDKTPEGDLFMVRDIGNQIATAKGSVEYGVNHLASSLLLIIGHSKCGAIAAASGDYSKLEPAIQKELDTIKINKGVENIAGVKTNVNNQVAAALEDFGDKVKAGHLLVLGAVYDFADEMKEGAGKLNIINVNGETDPAKVKAALSGKAVEGHDEHHK
ncbi:MAG: carbonic anhydrase [Nitrosomonadales bacterium]|nr:carbonic anhydrase [Nitrosomonadales bacterium]